MKSYALSTPIAHFKCQCTCDQLSPQHRITYRCSQRNTAARLTLVRIAAAAAFRLLRGLAACMLSFRGGLGVAFAGRLPTTPAAGTAIAALRSFLYMFFQILFDLLRRFLDILLRLLHLS